MNEHDEDRRRFLTGALAGAGVVAGAGLARPAEAQTGAPTHAHEAMAMPAGNAPSDHVFFNAEDAATVEAFAERLMPSAPGKPGAREAGVLNYIDLALAGAYADRQEFYRAGITALNGFCRARFGGEFRRLTAMQQDDAITALETDKADGFAWPTGRAFFTELRTHTMEGMFADPAYGGNRNFAGWRLIEFPGAQEFYTQAEMESGRAFSREPIMGLQAVAPRGRKI